jgi:hypothetical protein
MVPVPPVDTHDPSLTSSIDLSIDSSGIFDEKMPLVTSDSLLTDATARRTYVILTELDEPFFGPYPIEFTITI